MRTIKLDQRVDKIGVGAENWVVYHYKNECVEFATAEDYKKIKQGYDGDSYSVVEVIKFIRPIVMWGNREEIEQDMRDIIYDELREDEKKYGINEYGYLFLK